MEKGTQLKYFFEHSFQRFVIDQLMISHLVNEAYEIRIGNQYRYIVKFFIKISDEQKMDIENALN